MTDDLLRIASEMEAGDSFDDSHGTNSQEVIKRRAWAARIRACVSPEQVAFFEAAKECAEACYDCISDPAMKGVMRRAEKMKAFVEAHRALLAAQEKGEG